MGKNVLDRKNTDLIRQLVKNQTRSVPSLNSSLSLSLSLSLSHTHTHTHTHTRTQTHEFLSSNLWLLFNLLGFLPSTPSLLQNPLSFHPQTSTNPIHSNHSSSHPLQTNPMLNLQNPFHQIHQKQLQNQNQLLLTQ